MSDQIVKRDENSLAVLIERPEYKNRFGDVLGQRAPQFLSSLLSLQMNALKDVEPKSIIAAAMVAASLDLPINQNLGFAYIIAYKDHNRGGAKFAQFQMGYKGFIQLAQRSRQYKFINACRVFDGELVKYNKVTGELEVDESLKKSDKVIGYASYFRLTNGFEHALYMTAEQVDEHARKYSQAYAKGYKSIWKDDFDAMALKTVLKLNLAKWGPLSVQMEKGISADQAIRQEIDSPPQYPDNQEAIATPQIEGAPTTAGETEIVQGEEGPSKPADVKSEMTTPTPPKKGGKKAAVKTEAAPAPEPTPTPAEPAGKPTLTLADDAGADDGQGQEEEEKQPATRAVGPKEKELIEKINAAGFLLTEFLAFAVYNKWLPTPEGCDRENIDPADLEGVIIPEDRAAEFVQPDNFGFITKKMTERRGK